MRKTNKKGFTIVELVIVIAVIAILAAVLIPTYSSLVKKANQSADIQAVRNMNVALAAEVDSEIKDYQDAVAVLKKAGIDADSYKALSDGYKFVWDKDENRILYVKSSDNSVVYPEEYKTMNYSMGKWVQLTGELAADDGWNDKSKVTTVSGTYTAGDTTITLKSGVTYKKYTIENAEQLTSFAQTVRDDENKGEGMIIELKEDTTYDMLGAEWQCIPEFKGIFNGNGATIKNLAITSNTPKSGANLPSWTNNGYEPYAFISCFSGAYFGNVTFDVNIDFDYNVTTQNHLVAGAIGYVGAIESNSSVIIDSVTMKGSIRAPFRAAGIVGFVGGSATNKMQGTVTIQNCVNEASVTSYLCLSSYNTAAGIVSTANQFTKDAKLLITDCKNSGKISGSDVAGIMANCFAAYEVGSKNSSNADNPCGIVEITKCTNTGSITATHSCDTKGLEISNLQDVACAYAAGIVAPYGKQDRLYVHGNTSSDTVTAQAEKHNEANAIDADVKCGDSAFVDAGFYKTTTPTNSGNNN